MALDNITFVNYTDKETIKNWFKTGLKPTQAQFWSTWDSFWHKSESLPISSISGLGNLLDGKAEENHEHNQYAKNDATSLTADNVTAWQNKLGVADLKFDDKAITITQDYTDFGLVAGDSINAFNNAIYTEVAKKLDSPTENATNEYVLMADGSVVAKSEFGKVDKVMGVAPDANKNVDISGVAMNWTNASQRMSALPNKSADATFNQFVILDNNGNLGKADNAINALTNTMRVATDAQKDAWRNASRKSNETYSTGQPRVDLILPIVLIGEDSTLVQVNGLNLFLNNTDYSAKVEIIDVLSGQVVETITNIQVNESSPTTIYFNINRSLYEEYNHYTIRVTHNGIVSLVNNSVYFQIVNELIDEPINMGWDIKTERLEGSTKSYTVALNANNISIHSGGKNSLGQDESKPIIGFSDFYFTDNDSMMIFYQYTGKAPSTSGVGQWSSFFGIIPEEDIPSTALDLMTVENNYILKGGYAQFHGPVEYINSTNANIFGTNSNAEGTVNFTLFIQKGKIFIQFGGRIVRMNLPITSSGRYHLYFNNKGNTSTGSRTYSLNLLNSYKI